MTDSLDSVRSKSRTRSLAVPLVTTVILLTGVDGSAALADVVAGSSGSNAADSESGSLEEVVVTARRRAEDLQKTPVSVTSLSGAQVLEENVKTFQDLAGLVPSLEVTPTSSGGADLTIRGLGQTSDRVNQDVKTGLYINDMYVARQEGNTLSFFDVSSLQVLDGPQGTLFGKNTTGGAILLTTVLPGDDNTGYVQVRGGNYNRLDTEGAINLPINDQLLTRLSFRTQSADGFIKHVEDTGTSDNINDKSVRGQVRWLPTDKVTVDLLSEYNVSRTDGQTSIITACSNNGYFTGNFNATHLQTYCSQYPVLGRGNLVYGGATLSIPTDSIQTDEYTGGDYAPNGVTREGHQGPFANTTLWSENLRVNYQINDDLALKSITTFRRSQFANYNPTQNAPQDIYAEYDASTTNQITQEVNLTGKAFDERLAYVGGLYYFRQKTAWVEDTGPDWADPTGFLWDANNDYSSYAAYGQASYKITPAVELTAGVRETIDRKSANSSINLQTNYNGSCATFVGAFVSGVAACNTDVTGAGKQEWHGFSPRIQLSYQITPDLYTYASVSKGYNSGGFNQENEVYIGGGLLSYAPEQLTDYEVGIKSEWLNHTVRANLTVFRQNYSDIQTNVVVIVNGAPFGATETGASAQEQGIELELAYAPTPNLRFWANGSLLAQKYTSVDADAAASGLTLDTPVGSAPKFTYSLYSAYTIHLAQGSLVTPSVNWRAVGAKPDCPFTGFGSCYLPAYGLLGSRVEFKLTEDSPWTLALWGTNLLDRTVELGAELAGGFGVGDYLPGRPREFGAELRRKF